ncbi:hypothetical protein Golob_013006, partial [Gossypium lobatum]|nr:hypothetical protein [Gossypium lobatum]
LADAHASDLIIEFFVLERLLLVFLGFRGGLPLTDEMRLLDNKPFEDLVTTLWNGWNNRNNAIFQRKKEDD